jgi:hypothetical protein
VTSVVESARRIFVSYARQDNDHSSLAVIKDSLLFMTSNLYIDDLFDHPGNISRFMTVERALRDADTFLAVDSPRYLTTAWTRWEYDVARMRGIPILTWQRGSAQDVGREDASRTAEE